MWHCIQAGYTKSFTESNVKSGFCKSGLWPLDAGVVCQNGIRSSYNDPALVYPAELNSNVRRYFVEFKRNGPPEPVLRSGYICTQTGIELTRGDVRSELRLLEVERAKKRRDREEAENQKASDLDAAREEKRRRRELIETAKAMDRVHRHGLPFCLPRSLKERRKIARDNVLKRRYDEAMAAREP